MKRHCSELALLVAALVLAAGTGSRISATQLYGLARQLRRQLQEAAGWVCFTSPVAEIPGDEFHEQVHDWHGRILVNKR